MTADSEDTTSFDSLNVDCIVQILSFLPADDLNTFALCNQRCREARNNESLDQTRTGTIIMSSDTGRGLYYSTEDCFLSVLHNANEALNANYTILKIDFHFTRPFGDPELDFPTPRRFLRHVKRLELSFPPISNERDEYVSIITVVDLFSGLHHEYFPNLQELYVCGGSYPGLSRPSLSRVSLKGCDINGWTSCRHASELVLDSCRIVENNPPFTSALPPFESPSETGTDRHVEYNVG